MLHVRSSYGLLLSANQDHAMGFMLAASLSFFLILSGLSLRKRHNHLHGPKVMEARHGDRRDNRPVAQVQYPLNTQPFQASGTESDPIWEGGSQGGYQDE